jgi:hypothetical protein
MPLSIISIVSLKEVGYACGYTLTSTYPFAGFLDLIYKLWINLLFLGFAFYCPSYLF